MSVKSFSIWGDENYDSLELVLDCLLPSGFICEITVQKNATIRSIKKDLWKVVEGLPFSSLLDSPELHIFECIDENSENVEITDESRRMYDVRPFFNMLRLRRIQHSNDQQAFNNQLNILIGKKMSDLDRMMEEEVIQFRRKMNTFCYDIQAENDRQDWSEKMMRLYPPDLNFHKPPSNQPPTILITINIAQNNDEEQTFTSKLEVPSGIHPKELVKLVCSKQKTATDPDLYLLKVSGFQEYLIGDYPLDQFTHVRDALVMDQHPALSLVTKESVFVPSPIDASPPPPTISPPPPATHTTTLQLTTPFTTTLNSLSNVSCLKQLYSSYVLARACIYHGGEQMCEVVVSKEKILIEEKAEFQELQSFNISIQNLPRMSRLCLLVYSHVDKKILAKKVIKKKDMRPLAWVNMPLFDYQGCLKQGCIKLSMWPVTDCDRLNDQLLNPIGTVESNPQTEDAIQVELMLEQASPQPICYPQFSDVLEVAAEEAKLKKMPEMAVDKEHLRELEKLLSRDPFHVLAEQDKEMIWSLRMECKDHYPEFLPVLLACVKWHDHREVATMQSLLQIWPKICAKDALELLDFKHPDANVRTFAVGCLESLSDSDVCLYLLQLVQVLKYECYLDTALIRFLLKKALNNSKIGHNFFWLLRSEMHVISVSVRFSLFLEAYCRGSVHSMTDLCKIVEALNNLRQLNDHIKVCGLGIEKLKDEVRKALKYKEVLSQLCCPIKPSVKLKCVRIDQCKCMDSKMKPLWLVWSNVERLGNDMLLMFKKGDDLRQDMLTLQILRIMDNIWKENGLDLRMNVYSVLPTNQKEGLIEVVTDSSTQAEIQMRLADLAVTAAFNRKCIYQWLETHNPIKADFEKAMEVFMLSCAAYSVATYVLGVADRHSDNIMIKKNGQIFHIDFGHILGNFKSKFGVKRERCPFVLTIDYVYVIKRGYRDKEEFKRFETICEKAFMLLRKESKFLIALFMIMINTGIPEVSCFKDIEYLKETLVPHKTDEEALAHFKGKFTEALRKSWKTSLNFMGHNFIKAKNAP